MSHRKTEYLHPALQPIAARFVEQCAAAGVRVLIYMTYRSADEQNKLYAQGRTTPGKRVTNARGGQSKHNNTLNGVPASLAFDCVPLAADGSPSWDRRHPHWAVMGKIGKSLGLRWGGDWKTLVDKPHFELP